MERHRSVGSVHTIAIPIAHMLPVIIRGSEGTKCCEGDVG